jgi:hypothetical protein
LLMKGGSEKRSAAPSTKGDITFSQKKFLCDPGETVHCRDDHHQWRQSQRMDNYLERCQEMDLTGFMASEPPLRAARWSSTGSDLDHPQQLILGDVAQWIIVAALPGSDSKRVQARGGACPSIWIFLSTGFKPLHWRWSLPTEHQLNTECVNKAITANHFQSSARRRCVRVSVIILVNRSLHFTRSIQSPHMQCTLHIQIKLCMELHSIYEVRVFPCLSQVLCIWN